MSTETALALIARIAAEREAFNAEIEERRVRLAERDAAHRAKVEAEAAFQYSIDRQWIRLAEYHQAVRARFVRRFKRPPARMPVPVPADPDDWRAHHWELDRDGLPFSNIQNAIAALRESPALSGLIGLDLAENAVKLKGPLPFNHWESFDFEMRRMRDDDLTALLEYLQFIGLSTLTREDVLAAVRLVARENAWRPQDDG